MQTELNSSTDVLLHKGYFYRLIDDGHNIFIENCATGLRFMRLMENGHGPKTSDIALAKGIVDHLDKTVWNK